MNADTLSLDYLCSILQIVYLLPEQERNAWVMFLKNQTLWLFCFTRSISEEVVGHSAPNSLGLV